MMQRTRLAWIRKGGLAVALAGLAVLAGCDQRETLVTVDSQREALEILVELENAGVVGAGAVVQSRNRKDVLQITLAPSELGRARALLLQKDLPRRDRGGLESVVNGAGMIPTAGDERARLMYAISGELERTLEAIDGVSRARVHVVLPERDVLESTESAKAGAATTASVLLTVNWDTLSDASITGVPGVGSAAETSRLGVEPAANFSVERIVPGVGPGDSAAGKPGEQKQATLFTAVRSLVASAVPGLKAESVSVVVSYAPTRPVLARQQNLAGRLVDNEQKTKVLFIGTAIISVLFLLTLAWGIMRGRKPRDEPNDGFAPA